MAAIVEKNENENVKLVNLKEGMTAAGLWYINDKGEQGLVPRAKKDDNFNLTEEQHVLKEKWIKEIMRDYPNVDESTIDFICSFEYLPELIKFCIELSMFLFMASNMAPEIALA